jgi:hypothetical protein
MMLSSELIAILDKLSPDLQANHPVSLWLAQRPLSPTANSKPSPQTPDPLPNGQIETKPSSTSPKAFAKLSPNSSNPKTSLRGK